MIEQKSDGEKKLSFHLDLTSEAFAARLGNLMPALGQGPFDYLRNLGVGKAFQVIEGDNPRALKEALKGIQSNVYVRQKVRYIFQK